MPVVAVAVALVVALAVAAAVAVSPAARTHLEYERGDRPKS